MFQRSAAVIDYCCIAINPVMVIGEMKYLTRDASANREGCSNKLRPFYKAVHTFVVFLGEAKDMWTQLYMLNDNTLGDQKSIILEEDPGSLDRRSDNLRRAFSRRRAIGAPFYRQF